jgi:transposase
VDQSGLRDHDRPLNGWSLKGTRCIGIRPARSNAKVNIMAGLVEGKLVAPITYTENTTAAKVEEWFEHQLLPALDKGTKIIMDNAPFHRKKQLEALAEKAGCSILWLPPYAPDLNKIENSWATIKHYVRKFLNRQGANLKWALLRALVTFQRDKA